MKKRREKKTSEPDAGPLGDADSASEAESFGPWLRRQREGRRIELRDIADESKISLRYLEALETGRFEALPAEVFTKGFLRQYAGYVGLDAEEVVNYYLAAKADMDEKRKDELPEELRLDSKPTGTSPAPYVLVALVLTALILAIVWWLSTQRQESSPPDTTAAVETREDAAPDAGEAAATTDQPGAETGGDAAQAADDSQTAAGVEEPGPAETPAEPPPADTGSTSPDAPTTTAQAEPAGAAAPIRVVVDFTGDCWVEAGVDGTPRIAEMRVQGESLRLEGREAIDLKVGDVGATRIEVNGMPWQPPAGGSSVRQIVFDLETVAALRASAQ